MEQCALCERQKPVPIGQLQFVARWDDAEARLEVAVSVEHKGVMVDVFVEPFQFEVDAEGTMVAIGPDRLKLIDPEDVRAAVAALKAAPKTGHQKAAAGG